MRHRLATMALILMSVCATVTAFAAEPAQCPTLAVANSELQTRAKFLLDKVAEAQNPGALHAASVSGVDFIVALAGVIAGRAKEESRIWLVDQLSRQVCDSDGKRYFPNTCAAVEGSGEYPGASLNLLRTQLRRDIYSLPACYGYLHSNASADETYDSYVLEAALVGVYLKSKSGSIGEDAPILQPDPTEEVLGRLIVGAALARLKWWSAASLPTFAPSRFGSAASQSGSTCHKPLPTDIKNLADTAIAQLTTTPKPSPENIISSLIPAVDKFCPPFADDLRELTTLYVTAVHGDYVETALGAAGWFLCDKDNHLAPNLCARLPLLGEVAQADTQEELNAALDRVISPLGAWKRKQSEWVVSLNAMAGIAGGHEKFKDIESGTHSTYGLYMSHVNLHASDVPAVLRPR